MTAPLEKWLSDLHDNCVHIFRHENAGGQYGAAVEALKTLAPAPRDESLEQALAVNRLTNETRLVRRNLMVSATVTVLVSLGAQPGLMVTFSGTRTLPVLAGFIVTAFLLGEFVSYLHTDDGPYRRAIKARSKLLEWLARVRIDVTWVQVRNALGEDLKGVTAALDGVDIPEIPHVRHGFDLMAPRLWGAFALGCSLTALIRGA